MVFADENHPVNFVTCAKQLEDCPITSFDVSYDPDLDNLEVGWSKEATNLPILGLKLSTS